jgi:predicted ribosomally synthesized peptide with SipW-like signal peptide
MEEKQMNKRVFLSAALILLAVALIGGATMAWFTDSEELTNTFTAGTLEIDAEDYWKGSEGSHWDNVNPGDCDDKVFEIINKGSKHSLIRLQFAGEWGEYVNDLWVAMDPQDADLVTVTAPSGWTYYAGWWYYDGKLAPDMDPDDPFTFEFKVCVDGPNTDNDYQGMSYKFVFDIEAIQASNNASGDAWGLDSLYDPADEETALNWDGFDYPTL